jgi:hypothetical protein
MMLKTDEKMGPVSNCAACLLCGSRLSDEVKFATQEISFLGHLVSHVGVRIDPERTQVELRQS